MRREESSNFLPFLFSLFIFLFVRDVQARKLQQIQCPTSSCGDIKNISYPFRLKGDPARCGDPKFELSCESNKTILETHSGKYYVKRISYDDSIITVVDVKLADGSCGLPQQSLSRDYPWEEYKDYLYYILGNITYANFVRCSSKILDPTYRKLPCLNIGNQSYVYVIYPGIFMVSDLLESCSFISRVPVNASVGDNPSNETIQMLLQSGFDLQWCKDCGGTGIYIILSSILPFLAIYLLRFMWFLMELFLLVSFPFWSNAFRQHIFSKKGNDQAFRLERLHKIALGTARGIEYLHNGCDVCILHFDIKPHNILLDHNFIPKVADFGLAKFHPKENDFICMSATRGTIGYIAPELISRNFGIVSCKSDVYSFGMLLLEMAGGRRNSFAKATRSSKAYFPSWVYDQMIKGGDLELRNVSEIEGVIARKLCIIGLWCIQVKATDRPSITKVVEMLEGSIDDLQMPPRPFFASSFKQSSIREIQSDSSTELLESESIEECSNADTYDVEFHHQF
ncbi:hypothetical protein LWI28_006655 [Acer negundo]|uniref:Protein kinase domain-containing protein n=1 Tax=Acer negundo TaxID=4023 RepID=A0AAD5J474_ACENE|nr:hypothetical protein LWI28_006655 [Acer negundo]